MSGGGMAISSQMLKGTTTAYSGDIRTGETYSSDQSSQIEVTATPLSGGQWIGPGGQGPKRRAGPLSRPLLVEQRQSLAHALQAHRRRLDPARLVRHVGPLASGTPLTLSASGSALVFAENGWSSSAPTDTTLTGGAPGDHGLRFPAR